jgi:hypothetical protein
VAAQEGSHLATRPTIGQYGEPLPLVYTQKYESLDHIPAPTLQTLPKREFAVPFLETVPITCHCSWVKFDMPCKMYMPERKEVNADLPTNIALGIWGSAIDLQY